jgi:hypothetical protein
VAGVKLPSACRISGVDAIWVLVQLLQRDPFRAQESVAEDVVVITTDRHDLVAIERDL